MLPIPAAVLAGLPQAIRRPVGAEWTNDGGVTWTPCKVTGGDINADRTAETRYQASAGLVDVPTGKAGINTVSTHVRLWQGIQLLRRDVFWVPSGYYSVTGVSKGRTSVSVDLDGLEDELRAAQFPVSRTIGPDAARPLVEGLVGEALPGIPIAWKSGVNAGTVIPQVVADSDRWGVLSSAADSGSGGGIAQALGAEIYEDARGVITIAPIPTTSDPVVWRIARGYGGALIEPTPTQSSGDMFNVVAATGDAGDGAEAVGPVVVWDDDPHSLTYAGPDPVGDPLAPQRLGLTWVRVRVKRYSSPLLLSSGQAYAAARAMLADSLGVQNSISLTSVCNPALEPGDVIEAEVDEDVWERHVIDSLSWSLGGTSMSINTRTTTRRL